MDIPSYIEYRSGGCIYLHTRTCILVHCWFIVLGSCIHIHIYQHLVTHNAVHPGVCMLHYCTLSMAGDSVYCTLMCPCQDSVESVFTPPRAFAGMLPRAFAGMLSLHSGVGLNCTLELAMQGACWSGL